MVLLHQNNLEHIWFQDLNYLVLMRLYSYPFYSLGMIMRLMHILSLYLDFYVRSHILSLVFSDPFYITPLLSLVPLLFRMPFFLLFVNPCSNKRPLTVNFKQYLYQCLRSATRCRCLLCIHFSIIGFHDLIHDPARTSDRNSQALRQLMCIENITFSYICNGNDLQISASFIVPPVPIPTFRLILFSSS